MNINQTLFYFRVLLIAGLQQNLESIYFCVSNIMLYNIPILQGGNGQSTEDPGILSIFFTNKLMVG